MSVAATMKKLFGDSLVPAGGGDAVPTESLAGGGVKVIACYHSASWCGPCRAFTPVLAEAYTAALRDKGMLAVFVSSDRDEASFDEYSGKMPWPAVPFAAAGVRQRLSRKFKVSGIPALVLVDAASGRVITDDGRTEVARDPDGERFPWIPPPLRDVLARSPTYVAGGGGGGEVACADVLGVPTVLLYFSASWCPPCRGFTPQLVSTYNKLKEDGKACEIIFVSSDRDADQFGGYAAKMPWVALPFEQRELKQQLSERFGVQGIPALVVYDLENDRVINANGRAAVSGDPLGAEFPWHPKPVNPLNGSTASALNEQPCLVAFLGDGADDAAVGEVRAALEGVVAERKAARRAAAGGGEGEGGDAGFDDEGDEVAFFYAQNDPIVARVRAILTDPSSLVLISVSERGYYDAGIAGPGDINGAAVGAFLAAQESGALERVPLNM